MQNILSRNGRWSVITINGNRWVSIEPICKSLDLTEKEGLALLFGNNGTKVPMEIRQGKSFIPVSSLSLFISQIPAVGNQLQTLRRLRDEIPSLLS